MPNKDITNIVIVGYPKSGTTWASRLVSELLQCPFNGNWGFEKKIDSSLIEGESRTANFECFKAHHSYEKLKSCWSLEPDKIIYIVRDPRDIIVSGTHFFNSFFKKKLGLNSLKKHMLKTVIGKKYLQRRMTRAVLYGDNNLNEWLKDSWYKHFCSYKDKDDVLIIKYEELLTEGPATSRSILRFIGIELTNNEILNALSNQSFESRKNSAIRAMNKADLKLLRTGKAGGWSVELSKDCVHKIEEELGSFLRENNY